ncbi:STAS domain-containing protein [Streptomyces minutiscleroticus]|uniref:Sulfate transporter n=1 Tax=Streptomyces minutiscleroticus TaxID=68238 RepID=A0A918NNQ1_9ACTN|nr:STAS domain-containing protein [Streptomyces minutiscleroticus]GGX83930.1 sulfate transporter [Streptomyces minutiscleroticus]
MTACQPVQFSLVTRASSDHTMELAIRGDLDYDTGDEFLTAVNGALDTHAERYGPSLRHLHVDCAELTAIDSIGLSALLALRRRTHPAGVTLHFHRRPVHFVRMLEVTGTADHLVERADDTVGTAAPPEDRTGTAPASGQR